MLLIGGSGLGRTNALLSLKKEQNDIDKTYLYAKDLSESRYELLIKKRKDAETKHLSDLNAFIECPNTMDDVYKNVNDYNPNRKRKILIVFDDMFANIMTNKKCQAIIKEIFIRCRKLNISILFLKQFSLSVPKYLKLNSTTFLIMRISKKENCTRLQLIILQILTTNVSWRFTENAQENYILSLAIDTTLSASVSLIFRKNLFQSDKNDFGWSA